MTSGLRWRLFAGLTLLFAGLLVGCSALGLTALERGSAASIALAAGLTAVITGLVVLARR